MFKNITLKYRMILGGIAAVLIPFSIAGIIIYTQLSKSLMEMTEETSVQIARDIAAFIDATLKQEINLASSIAADPDIVNASKERNYRVAQEELESIHRRIGSDYFTIFLADKEGIVRADTTFSQQIGVNLSDRPYFQRARQGRSSVTGPFLPKGSATPEQPIFVVCAPIQDQEGFHGLVGIPFMTDFLVDTISRKNMGRTGYAYLMNGDGLVLVHPRKEFILKLRLLDQPGTEELRKKVAGNEPSGTASYSFEGVDRVAGLAGVDLTGWTVVFTQSRDEIMAPVNRVLSAIVISAILFLIVTTLIIIVFSRRLSTPIQRTMETMKQVTQHSTEIILQIGVDRRISYANPAYEKLTGLRSKDIIGTAPELTNPNNVPEEVIWGSLEAGTPWSGRVALKGKGLDAIMIDAMLVPLRDDGGVIQGYLEIGRDATAELMFEKRLQQAQKLEAIGTLAGGIAHDFNNILGGIFGYAELCLMNRTYNSETESYITEILNAAERARDLVSQILTFSRQKEVVLNPLRPKSVLREALKLLRASIPATINIESKIESDATIMAEPTQIHQVIMNLFTNAVHAIGDHVGTIRLELEDLMVDEDFTKEHPGITQGKHIVLRVSDTGGGIEPDILDRIFEPFFTTKPHGEGTGLGLSVVHGIVNKLKGIITAYSEVGKGTVFNVIIPCTELDATDLYQDGPSIKEGTESIAVVDDETAITATMDSLLTIVGYRVTAFTDGLEALEAIKADPCLFDVVITDYSMPHITGLGLAEDLKQAGINIPVILISGYLSKELETAARSAGISQFLTKPLTTHQLADAIQRALKKGPEQVRTLHSDQG